ncbi:MAG: MFS transporter [Halieaceae bacterium]|nr:MFS transporter [Halieaceae bacterium]
MSTPLNLASLLFSTALLLVGHGMQLTMLPLKAQGANIPDFIIAATASGYFLGFIAGCMLSPYVIFRVGHIRCFGSLAALFLSALLILGITENWGLWFLMRFIMGVAISGLYSVIESWLNSQTNELNRGRILSIYAFIVLGAMALGQFIIGAVVVDSALPFILASIFIALSIVPLGLSDTNPPESVHPAKLDFGLLYRRSKTAFAGTILTGVVVGSFWSLGAIFAARVSSDISDATQLVAIALIGGACFQYPIGWLSDRFDRRLVMLLLCLFGSISCCLVALTARTDYQLLAMLFFGGTTFPIYALALATAADNSAQEEFIVLGTSVILLNALGSAIAPLLLGSVMALYGAPALFWCFSGLCLLLTMYVLYQYRDQSTATPEEQLPFNVFSPDIAPLALDLDPRGPEEVEDVFELTEVDSSSEGFHDIPFPGQMKTDVVI